MSEFENQRSEITNSLKVITEIFKDCSANYRVVGSVLLVAYTNKIFRRIGDIDILIDKKNKDCIFKKLEENGFTLKKRFWIFFSWIEAHKNQHLGLTFLLVGKFLENYFSWRFMKFFELRMRSDYLKPTEYFFEGSKIIGIPISSVVAGIKQSFLNPKRKLDKKVLGNKNIESSPYNQISVYIFGMKGPFLYDVFSFIYNIYGGLRVIFGKKYEMW
jgi:hypothetical protein